VSIRMPAYVRTIDTILLSPDISGDITTIDDLAAWVPRRNERSMKQRHASAGT
jgi:hypothetical protein